MRVDRELVFAAVANERRRIASLIDDLDDAQLATLSLCVGWDVKTVAAHPADSCRDDETDDGPGYDWHEVPGALAGDIDIELLWTPEMDGIENPIDQTNVDMRIGDYRAKSWHHRFDRYAGDAEHPSALY